MLRYIIYNRVHVGNVDLVYVFLFCFSQKSLEFDYGESDDEEDRKENSLNNSNSERNSNSIPG